MIGATYFVVFWALIVTIITSFFTFSCFSSIKICGAVFTAGRVWIWWVGCGQLTRSIVEGAVFAFGAAARGCTVRLALMVSVTLVPIRTHVMRGINTNTSWCAGSLDSSIAGAVLAFGSTCVPVKDITLRVVRGTAVNLINTAGIFTLDGDTLVVLADGGGVLALGVQQASRFTFTNFSIVGLVAPLTGWTDSVPIIAIFIEPAAGAADTVRITNGFVSRTVGVLAAFGLADAISVRYLADQRTGVAGAVDLSWPVAHRPSWIEDGVIKFQGMVRTYGRDLRPYSAWSALKQAKMYASEIVWFA